MAGISFESVSKVYDGGVTAVTNFSADILDKEFVVIVGSSGSGKTTILRLIAGLEEITDGKILVGDRVINNVPVKDRGVAMVFQQYTLFPHYNVYKNILMGVSRKKPPIAQNSEKDGGGSTPKAGLLTRLALSRIARKDTDKMIKDIATLLEIEDILFRKPNTLSGGQRQRVALARAMINSPDILLLDEPLSNLDSTLKAEMRAEIIKIKSHLKTTVIYVTHDQVEALTLADRIIVMHDGRIMQFGSPREIYLNPKNKFVAGFIGTPGMNFVDGVLYGEVKMDAPMDAGDAGRLRLSLIGGEEEIPLSHYTFLFDKMDNEKRDICVEIRPQDIYLAVEKREIDKYFKRKVRICYKEETGSETLFYASTDPSKCNVGDSNIIIRVKTDDAVNTGDVVEAYFDKKKLHFFDIRSGEALVGIKKANE